MCGALTNASDPNREWPTYFYLAFYGPTFPAYVKDKEFLVPCWSREPFNIISPKLRVTFPDARVLNTIVQPHELPPEQNTILAITASPLPTEDLSRLPQHGRMYHLFRNSTSFQIVVYTNDSVRNRLIPLLFRSFSHFSV